MATAFQYGSVVVAHSKPSEGDWPDLVRRLVEYIQRNLDQREEPGWELVSHDILALDDQIYVTFFIRRPKANGSESDPHISINQETGGSVHE